MRDTPLHRRTRLPFSTALLLLLLTGNAGGAPHGSGADSLFTVTSGAYSIEKASQDGADFRRILAAEPGLLAEPGRPALPLRTLLLGIPGGTRLRVSIVSADSVDLPGERVLPAPRDTLAGPERTPLLLPAFDRTLYASSGWYPAGIVEAGEPGRMRNQAIAPIRVHTFRTIPSTGLLRVYRKIVLRVSFEPDGARKTNTSPTEPAGDDPFWEGIYARTLANAGEAGAFRTRKVRALPPSKRGSASTEWKISVRESGLYRIDFEELTSNGFPADVSIGAITLARRDFSESELDAGRDPFTESLLSVLVEDGDADGLFGAGDRIFAYLPGFREDRMKRGNDDRYASEAVYFLSTEGGGPALASRPGWRGYPGLLPLASFPDSIRWEKDAYYDWNPDAETLDVYYPVSEVSKFYAELSLPPADTNGTFQIRAMTVSAFSNADPYPYHRYVLACAVILDTAYIDTVTGSYIPGDTAVTDTVFDEVVQGAVPAILTSPTPHPASLLDPGVNLFAFRGSRGTSPSTTQPGAQGFLDWFEVRAPFLYRAREDRARFSTGNEIGRVQMEIGGFTGTDILVFDTSDRYAPVRVDPDSVRTEGDSYTFVFQDSVGAPRPYVAATRGGALRLEPGKIVRDEPSTVASDEADYLVVAYDDFLDAMEPLAAFRESQGFRVARAKISDVYDEFSGGVRDPDALQRYFRYAFDRWERPPAYVLLVGDAYEDVKGIADNADTADVDFVPTHHIFRRGTLGIGEANQWTGSDPWLVLLDGPMDYAPEMIIGRFPAGSAAEAAVLVAKTISYENERREEPWRRRVGFLADDAWVKDSAAPYHNGFQTAFETASFDLAKRVSSNSALRADTATFFLSRYTDVYHPLCPFSPPNPLWADHLCVLGLTRDPAAGATPAAFDFLNAPGMFLANYQGHGNRTSLTHELFLLHGRDTAFTGMIRTDLSDYSLAGAAPYIFLAFGCSISEFDAFTTYSFDALGENMILLPDRAAVLTYGSTAIEYLEPNIILNNFVLDEFFPTLEKEAELRGGSGAETVGELLTAGMADYVFDQYDRGPLLQFTVLGDPALSVRPREPTLAVTLSGETIPDGATRFPPADGSPWNLEARFRSDVYVNDADIRVLEDDQALDPSFFSVTAGDDSATNRWEWTVRRERPQDGSLRKIEFRFTDVRGRSLAHTLRTDADIALSFDGIAYEESLVVPSATRLRIDIGADVPLFLAEVRVEAGDALFPADTLYRTGDSSWAAEANLSLAEGEQDLVVSLAGLKRTFPVRGGKTLALLTVTVDGSSAANGGPVLGHLDGTAPEIDVRIESLPGMTLDSVRVLEGDQTVPPDRYELESDTADSRIFLRLTYRPALEEGKDIRFEAHGGGSVSSFLLRVSLPIEIRIDGAAVENGDYVAPESELRATARFAGEIPADEAAFFLDGAVVAPDTLRREGGDRWVAVAKAETGGGSHEVSFRAGAFSASRDVRVENRLRVLEPLAFPNPAPDRTGFFYQLTLAADEVRAEIYTLSGKRIRVLERLSARAGYNENREAWDLRDADGDKIARGVYLFRVVARRAGEKSEAIGKLVVGSGGS